MKSFIISTLIIGLCLSQNALPYNETLSIYLYRMSGMTYCDEKTLQDMSCTDNCELFKGKLTLVHFYKVDPLIGDQSYSIFYDSADNYLIAAFRGTAGTYEMIIEISNGGPVDYDLYPIPGAKVMDYFYLAYKNHIREDFLTAYAAAMKTYPTAVNVFTGHSLGAALASHAHLDVVLGGMVNANNSFQYNFGSPRVGNFEWASYFVNHIPTIYRVVHYKDMVPHVPPCWYNTSLICLTGNDTLGQNVESERMLTGLGDEALWHAWHVWTNLWYDLNCTSYVVCEGGEDPKCADQYNFFETTFADHNDYFNIEADCDGQSTLKMK